jgi:hypothetical protein
MEKKDFYIQWKEYRRDVPVPDKFAGGVMAAIESQGVEEEFELSTALSGNQKRLLQWSAAASLLLLGIMRIAFIAANLLQANSTVSF